MHPFKAEFILHEHFDFHRIIPVLRRTDACVRIHLSLTPLKPPVRYLFLEGGNPANPKAVTKPQTKSPAQGQDDRDTLLVGSAIAPSTDPLWPEPRGSYGLRIRNQKSTRRLRRPRRPLAKLELSNTRQLYLFILAQENFDEKNIIQLLDMCRWRWINARFIQFGINVLTSLMKC